MWIRFDRLHVKKISRLIRALSECIGYWWASSVSTLSEYFKWWYQSFIYEVEDGAVMSICLFWAYLRVLYIQPHWPQAIKAGPSGRRIPSKGLTNRKYFIKSELLANGKWNLFSNLCFITFSVELIILLPSYFGPFKQLNFMVAKGVRNGVRDVISNFFLNEFLFFDIAIEIDVLTMIWIFLKNR